MAATATAPKTAPRTPSGRRPPARRSTAKGSASARTAQARRTRRPARGSTRTLPIPGRLVPLAAGAVSGLADSRVVLRLTRGRLWIGALAVLLVGIVALNVVALSFTASSSETARSVEAMTREGSALRAQLATELSNERVQTVASMLGLIVPEPGSIRYRRPSEGDAAEAARRLRSGELTTAPALAPAPTDPGATATVAPPASAESPAEPVAEPAVEAPAPTTAPPPGAAAPPPDEGPDGGGASAGGVTPP